MRTYGALTMNLNVLCKRSREDMIMDPIQYFKKAVSSLMAHLQSWSKEKF